MLKVTPGTKKGFSGTDFLYQLKKTYEKLYKFIYCNFKQHVVAFGMQ